MLSKEYDSLLHCESTQFCLEILGNAAKGQLKCLCQL